MTLGPVMIDLVGTEVTPQELEMLKHPNTGGVILFTRNFESPQQLQQLVKQIHSVRDPHLLVAVDHEGGRVQRFHEGFTRLPPVAVFGHIYDTDHRQAKQLSETAGWLMAIELRAFGIDFSFAPVLDLGHGISGVIGDRAFHQKPEVIAELAADFMRGMNRAGMKATGKHFPGHGSVKEDSHVAHPVDHRQLADIMMEDVIPFERLIHKGLAAIMPAHVVYPEVDSAAAGYSRRWLQDILRGELEFQGVIFSDDLSMEAASPGGSFLERARHALNAGCDMALVCNHPEGAREVLEGLGDYSNPASALRLVRMHGQGNITREQLQQMDEWKKAVAKIRPLAESPYLEMDI